MDNDFLSEVEALIDAMSQGIISYESALKTTAKIDPDILNGVFRSAHTLKGLGGVFGYQEMSKLAHGMENLLSEMRLGKIVIGKNVLDVLFEAVEKLEEMSRSTAPNEVATADIHDKLNSVAEGSFVQNKPVTHPPEDFIPADIKKALIEYEEHRLEENLLSEKISLIIVMVLFSLDNFDSGYYNLTDWLKKYGEIIATLPNSKPDVPDKISFQILFATEVDLKRLSQYLNKFNVRVKILKDCSF